MRGMLDDPEHWRERAKEARHVGDQMNDPMVRQTLLQVALLYERVALRAESRASAKISKRNNNAVASCGRKKTSHGT
jgi:hypothetical protein